MSAVDIAGENPGLIAPKSIFAVLTFIVRHVLLFNLFLRAEHNYSRNFAVINPLNDAFQSSRFFKPQLSTSTVACSEVEPCLRSVQISADKTIKNQANSAKKGWCILALVFVKIRKHCRFQA